MDKADVYIALPDAKMPEMMVVVPARDYQKDAYYSFDKKINKCEPLQVSLPQGQNFSIMEFDRKGLQGTYDDFVIMVTEYNGSYILSKNKEKLRGFVGFRNRMVMQGGSKTYKKTSKKSSKKVKKSSKKPSKSSKK